MKIEEREKIQLYIMTKIGALASRVSAMNSISYMESLEIVGDALNDIIMNEK